MEQLHSQKIGHLMVYFIEFFMKKSPCVIKVFYVSLLNHQKYVLEEIDLTMI
jgi:hypothetical protein